MQQHEKGRGSSDGGIWMQQQAAANDRWRATQWQHKKTRRHQQLWRAEVAIMDAAATSRRGGESRRDEHEKLRVSLHLVWPPRRSASDENQVQIRPCGLPRPTPWPRGPCICQLRRGR
uniref:Uncharacterized protein n=1 Tax=Hordeum vulgare subsp. vulgare TaxID=112509 RepID=A0A8I6WJW1_HORVV